MKTAFYIDKKDREVLYVPLVCVIVNYARKIPEIILDPKKLKLKLNKWKKGTMNLRSLIGLPEIDQEDITTIINFCLQDKIPEAKSYCMDIFDEVVNREYGIEWRKIKCP